MGSVPKILVVDDEESLRHTFQIFLKQCGFEVLLAPDPEGAEVLLSAHEFDVAVVDRFFSGGQNGGCLIRRIRKIQPCCQKILISANPTFESAANGIESDISAYLVKPVKKETLCRTVLKAVKRSDSLKQLKQNEAFFYSIFGNSPNAIVISDLSDRIVFANPEFIRLFGYASDEIFGRPFPNVPVLEREKTEAERFDLIRGIKVKERETVRLTRDRRQVRVTISPSLVKDRLDRPSHIVRILRDVTEARICAREIAQAEKMEAMGHMAGEIGHNFGQLLEGISDRARVLMSGQDKNRSELESAEQIEKACRAGRQLADQLLELGSDPSPGNAETEINAVSAKLFGLMSQAQLRSIGIDWQAAEEAGRAKIDQHLLEQCLFNLVINARDAILRNAEQEKGAGRKHHTISIRSREITLPTPDADHHIHLPPGPYVQIAVADTGPGIPVDIQERIFDPFFSAEKRANRTGLGLSTVYRIVKNHQGCITIDSTPGKGTTFCITLPAGDSRTDFAP